MNDEYSEELDELLSSKKNKKKKHDSLINQLKDIESEDNFSDNSQITSSFLPSSMLKQQKKKDENKEVYENENYDPDNWFNEMIALQSPSMKSRDKAVKELFNTAGFGKKKKKKKEKNKNGIPIVNYKKEFEPEMSLYKNLQVEQNKFVDSLQKQYDYMINSKGSARGVTKQFTDLVENLNSARSLSMQLIEKNVNAKKLIAELSIKQNKELGLGSNEGTDMANFASNYLKKMLADKSINSAEGGEISDYTSDEMFEELNSALSLNIDDNDDIGMNDESNLYLKYENSNVQIYAKITDDDVENYEFVAMDEEGNEIDEYPLPTRTNISINRSTNIATDTYGKKFPIMWN